MMAAMMDGLGNDAHDMFIIIGIEERCTFPSECHKAEVLQKSELVGNCRLDKGQFLRYFVDGMFPLEQ